LNKENLYNNSLGEFLQKATLGVGDMPQMKPVLNANKIENKTVKSNKKGLKFWFQPFFNCGFVL
jgi:hypothetical protein